ncbi:MAG: hypothetical protein EBT09_01280 [Actinobacteria bacterium]|nr:hypothetical protein [Actinomycetota bacterium]
MAAQSLTGMEQEGPRVYPIDRKAGGRPAPGDNEDGGLPDFPGSFGTRNWGNGRRNRGTQGAPLQPGSCDTRLPNH